MLLEFLGLLVVIVVPPDLLDGVLVGRDIDGIQLERFGSLAGHLGWQRCPLCNNCSPKHSDFGGLASIESIAFYVGQKL